MGAVVKVLRGRGPSRSETEVSPVKVVLFRDLHGTLSHTAGTRLVGATAPRPALL